MIISIVILFLGLLSFNWYINIGENYEYTDENEVRLGYEQVIGPWNNFDIDKKYYQSNVIVINKSRTMIPFVYKNDTIHVDKTRYYSRDKK